MPRFNAAKANHNRRISKYDAVWANRATVVIPRGVEIKTAKDGRRYYLRDGKAIFIQGSKPTR